MVHGEQQMRQLFRNISLSPEKICNGEQVFDMVKNVLGGDLGTISSLTLMLVRSWSSVLRLIKSGLDHIVRDFMALFRKSKRIFRSIWHWLLASWDQLWD